MSDQAGKPSLQMDAGEVLRLITIFTQQGITTWIDGGWAVDALLGSQRRIHADLDIAILHRDSEALRRLLETEGYPEVPRDDSWECNYVMGDAAGHEVDVHTCTFDEQGKNIFGVAYPFESLQGRGSIKGKPVACITPEWLVKFHTGYPVDVTDYRDVKVLCERFGLEMPEEYLGFEG